MKIVRIIISIIVLVSAVGVVLYFVNEEKLNKYEIKFLDDYKTIYNDLMIDEIFEIEVKVTNYKGELVDKPVTFDYVEDDIVKKIEIIGNKATYQVNSYGRVRITVYLEEDSDVKSSIDLEIKKENVVLPTVIITEPDYFEKKLKLGTRIYIDELPILINDEKDFSKIEFLVATGIEDFIVVGYDSIKNLDYFEIVGVGSGTISVRSTHFNKDLLSIDYQTNFNNDEMYHILGIEKGMSLTADQITEYNEIKFTGGSLTNLDDLKHFTFLKEITSLNSTIGNLDFSNLPMLENIEILNNLRNGTDIIKISLENMPRLKSFDFTNALIDELTFTNETDKELDVNKLPLTVKKLNISGYEFELLDLTKFSKLESLKLSNILTLQKITLSDDKILSVSLFNLPKLNAIENILETTLTELIIDNVDTLLVNLIDGNNNFIVSDIEELSIKNVAWTIDKLKLNSLKLKKLTLKNLSGKFSELNLSLDNLEYLFLENVYLDNLVVPSSVDELSIISTGIKKIIINNNDKLNLKLMKNQELEDFEVRNVSLIEEFIVLDNNSIKNFIVDNSVLSNLHKVNKFSDKLEKVQITSTKLTEIDFSIFNVAKIIDVSDNNISNIKPFVNHRLIEFKLSNNLLTSTDSISGFPQLVTLYLDNNLIKLVKFNDLINLEKLHIENNNFYKNESFNYRAFDDILLNLKEITLYTEVDISSKAIDNYLDYLKELEKFKNLKVIGKLIHHVSQELIFQNNYYLNDLTFNYLGNDICGSDFYFVYNENEHPYINIKDDLIIADGIGEHIIKLQHRTDEDLSYFLKYSIKFSEQALNDLLDINSNSYTQEELDLITELEFDQYEAFSSLKELDYFKGLKKVTFSNGVIPNFDFTLNNNIEEVVIKNNTDDNANLIFADNQLLSKINLSDANIFSFEIRYGSLEKEITELILPKTLNNLVISGIKIDDFDLSNLEVSIVSLKNSYLNKISVKEQQEISNFTIENIITNESVVGFKSLKITEFTSANNDLNFFELFDNEGNILINTLESIRLIDTIVENINLSNSILTKLHLDNTMTKNLVLGKNIEELTIRNNNELDSLEITETKLKRLILSNLENINEVKVTNNKNLVLVDFSNTIYNLLTDVDISNNILTSLPRGVRDLYMPFLSKLNISYNPIEGDISSLNNFRTLNELIVGEEIVIELDIYKKYIDLKKGFIKDVVTIIEPIDIIERIYVYDSDTLSNIDYSEFTTYLVIQSGTDKIATIKANFVHLHNNDLKVEFDKVNLIGRGNQSAIKSDKDANLTLIGNNTHVSLVGVSNDTATIDAKNLILSGSFTIEGGTSLNSNFSGGTAIKAKKITFENAKNIIVKGGKGFDGLSGVDGTMGNSGTSKDPNGKTGNPGGVGGTGTNGGKGLDISNSITVINSSVTVTGGTGGAGGRGGKGGQGGTGYSRPPQNIFNKGGNGGDGGKGGKGGNPGIGGLAFSNIKSEKITYANGSMGNIGQGGQGGDGGKPGKGSLVTSDGNWGSQGRDGDPSNV